MKIDEIMAGSQCFPILHSVLGQVTLILSFLDPVRFFGESEYNLNNLKEISVTDSFMGLDRPTRNCQNMETYNDCITRYYIDNMKQKCGCLPLSHIMSDKVSYY